MTKQLRKTTSLTVCAVFLMFICSVLGKVNPPILSTISDVQTGALTITSNQGQRQFAAIYSTPFQSPPSVALAIPNINLNPVPQTLIFWKVDLSQPTNMTHVKIAMRSVVHTAFASFKVSYLAISGNLDYLKIQHFEIPQASIQPLLNGVGTRSASNIERLEVNVDRMKKVAVVHYVSGLQIGSLNSQKSFSLAFTIKTQSSILWNATCYGSTFVSEIASYIVLYDATFGEPVQKIFMNHMTINGKQNLRDQLKLQHFDQASLLVGVSSFHFTHGFSFGIEPATLKFSKPTKRTSFGSVDFSLFVLASRKCQESTPYFEEQSNLCYDICPSDCLAVEEPVNSCLKCSSLIENCAHCISKDVCSVCLPGYELNQTSNGCFRVQSEKNIRNLQSYCAGMGFMGFDGECYGSCPSGMFGVLEIGYCFDTCPSGLLGDPRFSLCVTYCEYGWFADLVAQQCAPSCRSGFYGDFSSSRCVTQCPNGLFGSDMTRMCVTQCPAPYFASQAMRKCVLSCPTNYFADNTTRSCVTMCPVGFYGDRNSSQCTLSINCPPGQYGDNMTRTCVQLCPTGSYANQMSKICVAECSHGTFADVVTRTCVTQCFSPFFADSMTRSCVMMCPNGFFGDPVIRACVMQCSMGLFADINTNLCVAVCPAVPTTYAQNNTGQCVNSCPSGSFAQNSTRICVMSCWGQTVGNPITNQCVNTCPQTPALYANYQQSICVLSCPGILFGFLANRTCVMECPTAFFGENVTRTCVQFCPSESFANQMSKICVAQCPDGTFADVMTRACVTQCISPFFADSMTRSCAPGCPNGFFGDPITRACVMQCSMGFFADMSANLCVVVCPVNPMTYGQNNTAQCVNVCPSGSFAQNSTRLCVMSCWGETVGNPITNQCVNTCPQTPALYANYLQSICVPQCPGVLYGFSMNRTCVMECPTAFFGENMTRTCVLQCPAESYANQMSKICVAECPDGTFADVNSARCVSACPAGFYADMVSRKCVLHCPGTFFADDLTLTCVAKCPIGLYADFMSAKCVPMCPANSMTYGQNSTGQCVNVCPSGSFAQNSTRLCVASCWGETVGNPITNQCVNTCPQTPALYANYLQSICVPQCPVMLFGLLVNRTCVMECPFGLYRQNSTHMCTENCTAEPHAFADNITGYCAQKCSFGMWGDSNTQVCVLKCPAGYFGNDETRTCVQTCPMAFFGDLLTKTCVTTCPTPYSPNDQTRLCESACPAGTWSDMTTQQCVSECPAGSYGYAQTFACVTVCPTPYFANAATKKCVAQCSDHYYANPDTKICVDSTGCAPNFGVNETRMCQSSCPDNQWKNVNVSRCDACDSSCKTCVGPSTYNCTSCNSDAFYLPATMQCLACAAPCSTCLSESNCSSCIDGSYMSGVNQCFACDVKCKTCFAFQTNCTSCAPDRILLTSNFTCACISGFEDAQGNCASLCTDGGCESCPNDKNNCLKCKNQLVLTSGSCKCPNSTYLFAANNSCINCHPHCSSCSGPLQTQCTECSSVQNRQLNKNTSKCDCKASFYTPNNQSTCIKEPLPSCPTGFQRDSTGVYCTEICGDGKLYEFECDDGNLENGDGCDFNCKIEANFSCFNNKTDEPTICSYKGRIIFELISALKDIYGNIIKLEYRMIPKLKYYEMFPDFKKSIKLSESSLKKKTQRQIPMTSSDSNSDSPFSILSALYSSNSKTLLVDVGYNETATGKTLVVSYTPEETPYSHAMDETSYEWPIQVSNGLSLIYYPDDIYSQTKTLNTVVTVIYFGSLCLFVLALFFRKMIGVEMIILVQAQVLSLSMLKEIHPTLGVLTEEKYAFGYNQLDELMNFKLKNTEQNIGLYKAINFSSVFCENINIMIFVVCLVYIVATIVRLVAIGKQKGAGEKVKRAAMVLARQIAFGFLLFSIMNLATSYVLQVYAGTIFSFSPEYNGAIKIAAMITIIANYLIYGSNFKDSVDSFLFYARNSKLSKLQPLFIVTKAILIAVGIALYAFVGTPILYALMGLQAVYILFVLVLKPFSKHLDLVRSLIIELSLLYIFASKYILIGYVKLEQPGEWTSFLKQGLFAEHVVTALSLLISTISFIFHLLKTNSQISPEQTISENKGYDKKQKDLYQSSLQIQEYIRYGFESQDKKKSSSYDVKFGETYVRELHNNSTTQIINLSEGEGYDSKRKLYRKAAPKTMEIIEMDD